ncbi:MAG: ABC transporter permease subunit [Pseudomonadota bacterium]|uniref:ABC transporter permease n=1 Tax=Phenylobacterium sp. TaxID=1871053 RepID=UPI0025E81171|nr:ABC transporter permease subunit [Phenylobacterium sp.]MBT9470545.1 ABC transporter permease subunit [Phenylobacterium sp.]
MTLEAEIQPQATSGKPPLGLWALAFRRFRANRAAIGGVVMLGLITVAAIFIPMFWPHEVGAVSFGALAQPPSFADFHWFGTDANGRDLFVRVFFGARVSLAIGLVATLVSLLIGVIYGATAGYAGGLVDTVMMRVVDVMYALPLLFLIIVLVTIFGSNIFLIFAAIGCVEWLTMARIVRGQTLSIKQREYMESARAIGLSHGKILRRYVIPNAVGPVIVYSTILIPINIIIESALSFLGLGVQEPLTSWGLLVSQGAAQIDAAPWMLIFPGLLLAVTMFCFNFIGDGLRDALDPKGR